MKMEDALDVAPAASFSLRRADDRRASDESPLHRSCRKDQASGLTGLMGATRLKIALERAQWPNATAVWRGSGSPDCLGTVCWHDPGRPRRRAARRDLPIN